MTKRAPVKMVIVHKKTWAKREIEVPFGGTFNLDKDEAVDWPATQGMYWRRVDELEAKNARLQERVEELKEALEETFQDCYTANEFGKLCNDCERHKLLLTETPKRRCLTGHTQNHTCGPTCATPEEVKKG